MCPSSRSVNGTGIFTKKSIEQQEHMYASAVGDIDDDGDVDIVSSEDWETAPIRLWRNEIPFSPKGLNVWGYVEVDNTRDDHYFGIAFGKINSDDYWDIVSGRYYYKNPGGDMTGQWGRTIFPIDADAMFVTDVDGDQYADVIAESLPNVNWLEATNTEGTSWVNTVIGTVTPTAHTNGQGYILAQLVAGGKPEIVIAGGDGVYYFGIPSVNPGLGNWSKVKIISDASEEGIGVGDIDRDGLEDVLISSVNNLDIFWAKNPGNGSGNWQKFKLGTTIGQADRKSAADINEDGRIDLVVSEEAQSGNASVYWFEQPLDPTVTWTRHLLVTQNTTNSLDTADMDKDGDIDIITGEHRGTKEVAIWENKNNGQSFVKHLVSAGKESHLGARVNDLDNDGDLDISSIAYDNFQFLYLWRNDNI